MRDFYKVMAAGTIGWAMMAGGCAKSKAQIEMPQFTERDRSIEVEVNQQFMIVLRTERAEGRQWFLAEPLEGEILRLAGISFWMPSPSYYIPDNGEQEHWVFSTVSPGRTTIRLIYGRPWEPHRIDKVVTFHVTVHPIQ